MSRTLQRFYGAGTNILLSVYFFIWWRMPTSARQDFRFVLRCDVGIAPYIAYIYFTHTGDTQINFQNLDRHGIIEL